MGRVLSGKHFNQLYSLRFYKLLHKDLTHRGYKYHHGLNIDPIKFNADWECVPGGFYFTDKTNLSFWCNNSSHTHYCRVLVPDDANVHIETMKFKASCLWVDINNKKRIARDMAGKGIFDEGTVYADDPGIIRETPIRMNQQ